MWEMSEPGIYDQAAYTQLLSRFVVNLAFGCRLGATGWVPAADLNGDDR